MYYFAILTDFIHALAMIIWVAGLPLLFWHRYSKLSIAYAIYSILFIIINLLSHYLLGHCILTEIASYFWNNSSTVLQTSPEWFTIRFSKLIFGLTPSHNLIKRLTEALIFISSCGVLYFLINKRIENKINNVKSKSWPISPSY